MSAPGGFQPAPPRRELNFSVLTEAFELIKPHWPAFSLFTLIAAIPAIIAMTIWMIVMFSRFAIDPNFENPTASFLSFYGTMGFVMLVIYAIIGPYAIGVTKMVLMTLKGNIPTVKDGLPTLQNLIPLVLLGIAQAFLVMLGTLACFIGQLFVAGLLMPLFVIFEHEKLSITDSIKRSFEIMKDHWLLAGVLYFLVQLIIGVSSYLCYVPVLFAIPWALTVYVLVYRDLTGNLMPDPPAGATNYPRQNFGTMPNYGGPTTIPEQDPPPQPPQQ